MLGRAHWDVHRPVDILQGGKYLGQYAICAFTVQVFRPAYLVIHSQVRLRQLSKELSPTVHLHGKSVRPHPGFPGPAKQLQPLAAGRIVESQVLDGVGPFVNGNVLRPETRLVFIGLATAGWRPPSARAPSLAAPPRRQGYGGATPVSGFVAFCLGQVPAPAGFPGIHPGIAIKREVPPGAIGAPSPVAVAWFFCSLG